MYRTLEESYLPNNQSTFSSTASSELTAESEFLTINFTVQSTNQITDLSLLDSENSHLSLEKSKKNQEPDKTSQNQKNQVGSISEPIPAVNNSINPVGEKSSINDSNHKSAFQRNISPSKVNNLQVDDKVNVVKKLNGDANGDVYHKQFENVSEKPLRAMVSTPPPNQKFVRHSSTPLYGQMTPPHSAINSSGMRSL
jgi:hypothetical protein